MELYDWLLFLHVLSAFILVASVTALWALVFATRPGAEALDAGAAERFGAIAGPLAGVGMMGTIVFGVWLALDLDVYGIFDGWIVSSLVLWAVGGWSGDRAGREFRRDPVGARGRAITFQAVKPA